MKLRFSKLLSATVFFLVASMGIALAQHPLQGTYVEQVIGFVVSFGTAPDGQLTATLFGAGDPVPVTIQADQQTASGWFMLENQITGFSAQLQEDGSTLNVWLYGLDAGRQPIPGTEEEYTAIRQQVDLPGVTQPPTTGGPPIVAPPPETGAVPQPPAIGQPPVTQPPAIGQPPVTQPPRAIQPPAIGQPPVSQPPVSQAPEAPADSGTQLVGRWATSLDMEGITFVLVVDYNDDGTYREEGFADEVPAAWYSGNWVMTQDDMLQVTINEMSPEFCILDDCMPNTNDGPTYASVQFVDADTVVVTEMQSENSREPAYQYTLQRVAGNP